MATRRPTQRVGRPTQRVGRPTQRVGRLAVREVVRLRLKAQTILYILR